LDAPEVPKILALKNQHLRDKRINKRRKGLKPSLSFIRLSTRDIQNATVTTPMGVRNYGARNPLNRKSDNYLQSTGANKLGIGREGRKERDRERSIEGNVAEFPS